VKWEIRLSNYKLNLTISKEGRKLNKNSRQKWNPFKKNFPMLIEPNNSLWMKTNYSRLKYRD